MAASYSTLARASTLYVDKSTGSTEYYEPLLKVFYEHRLDPTLVRKVNTASNFFGNGGGDFVFSGYGPGDEEIMIGIELKNLSDFVHSSLSSDRLSSFQLPNMASVYNRLYLILEGSYGRDDHGALTGLVPDLRAHYAGMHWIPLFLGKTVNGNRAMPYSRFIGQLHSLAEGYDLRVLTADTKDITAYTVFAIWSFWQKPYASHSFSGNRALKSPSRLQTPGGSSNVFRFLTTCVYGIGQDRARAIAAVYPTIDELMKALPKDLKEIEGAKIGSTLATKIWNSLRNK